MREIIRYRASYHWWGERCWYCQTWLWPWRIGAVRTAPDGYARLMHQSCERDYLRDGKEQR